VFIVFITRETNQNSSKLSLQNLHPIRSGEGGVPRLLDDKNDCDGLVLKSISCLRRFFIEIMHDDGVVLFCLRRGNAQTCGTRLRMGTNRPKTNPCRQIPRFAPADFWDGQVVHGETEVVDRAIVLHGEAQHDLFARVRVQVAVSDPMDSVPPPLFSGIMTEVLFIWMRLMAR
jgi:hypothetical protein